MNAQTTEPTYILTFSADDQVGIVAAVSSFLADRGGFIEDSQQFAARSTGRFYMRVVFTGSGPRFPKDADELREEFKTVAERFGMDWQLNASTERLKIMIAVSKGSHVLNDLLHRWSAKDLPVDITAVVGNHETLRSLTEWHGVPFHYLPVSNDNRAEQEQKMLDMMDETGTDLLILARYMQILSDEMTRSLEGRCINIHHSFLPAFKGAQPYHRAHARGVKLIGATAHFVTADLDEGPIIEQDVERVDHRATVDEMIRIGRDTEARVMARAVRAAAQRRLFQDGQRTVVFR